MPEGVLQKPLGAVIQQSSAREREPLEASVGVRQPTLRVDIAQSERVRSGGDPRLGLERSPAQARLFLHKARELVLHFLGVVFLSGPSLCVIMRHQLSLSAFWLWGCWATDTGAKHVGAEG